MKKRLIKQIKYDVQLFAKLGFIDYSMILFKVDKTGYVSNIKKRQTYEIKKKKTNTNFNLK